MQIPANAAALAQPQPRSLARSSSGYTTVIACLVARESEYGRDVAKGVNQWAQTKRNWVVLHAPPADARTWLAQQQCDGLISQNCDPEFVNWVRNRQLPAVNVSARLPAVPLPTVVVDNRAAGRLAAEHLLACGLRQFAAVGVGPRELHFADLRLAGFTERILAERLDCAVADPRWGAEAWRATVRLEPGAAELLQWLRALPKPVGLFAVSHTIGPLLVQACRLVELRVPAEVAVVAVDNDTVHCESIHPAISSVALNGCGVGLEAAQLLERMLGGGAAPTEPLVVAPGGVVARGSSALPSAGSDAVAAAVSYIQNHFQRPLYVEEIARHVGLSRWHLQRLFVRQHGCSLVEEINRNRLRQAKELLTGTDLPTAEVARLCGFARREYFSVLFSRVVGDSPAQYRRHSQRGNEWANPQPPLPGSNPAAGPAAATVGLGGSGSCRLAGGH